MKLASLLEGGLAGATTLSLIQEALYKIDSKAPRPFLHQSGALKKFKNYSEHKGKHKPKDYVQLAGELLGTASIFGLSGLGKKKNALLRGGVLGLVAGLGAAYLNDLSDDEALVLPGERLGTIRSENEELKKKILTVVLYTAGGVLAGAAVKKIKKGSFKKMTKKLKKKK
jgi:hypothetical protein